MLPLKISPADIEEIVATLVRASEPFAGPGQATNRPAMANGADRMNGDPEAKPEGVDPPSPERANRL